MSRKLERIYHTWDKWECYPAGFYENRHPELSKEECIKEYQAFLKNLERFSNALERVIKEWNFSCEHYLTNERMNRIAWLDQASLCIETGIPACYRSGFFKLSENEQLMANMTALNYLNIWLIKNNYKPTDLLGAGIKSHADIY